LKEFAYDRRVLAGPYMAGFEVAAHGRFWVAAEASGGERMKKI